MLHVAHEELLAAVEEVAGRLLTECGVAGPPVDALLLARQLRLDVAWDDSQQARARCVRVAGLRSPERRGAIFLRPEPRQERRQWAVAHEIGEHSARQVFELLQLDPAAAEAGARETIANRLAAAILLPLEWFATDAAATNWSLPALKQQYSTASHELIARRMLDCAVPIVATIFDNGRRTLRIGNFDAVPRALLPVELACWRQSHDNAQPCVRYEAGIAVQAWPIHEPDWQREILRTTIAEGYDA